MAKVTCPECDATLNPARPLTPGKKVKCPRCENVFTVPFPEFEDEEEAEEPARKKAPAQKAASGVKKQPPAKPTADPKPAAAKPPAAAGEDDDEGGLYGFLQSKEEEEDADEKKPLIEYAPKETVKDPRGPATKKLSAPSNWMIIHGAELFFGGLLVFTLGLWPFVFGKYLVAPKEVVKVHKMEEKAKKKRESNPSGTASQQEEEEYVEDITEEDFRKQYGSSNPQLITKWEEMVDEKQETCIWMIAAGLAAAFYGVFVCYSGVQMQNMESYVWSIVGGILILVSGLALGGVGLAFMGDEKSNVKWTSLAATGIGFGIWSLILLKDPQIKKAYEYKPE